MVREREKGQRANRGCSGEKRKRSVAADLALKSPTMAPAYLRKRKYLEWTRHGQLLFDLDSVVILASAFSQCGQWYLAASTFGGVVGWKMDTYLAPTSSVWNHGKNERDLKQFVDEGVAPSPGDEENDDSDEEMANSDDDTAASETSFGFKAHRSAVNAIAVTEKFLITGGDEELRVWSRPWENWTIARK